MDTKPKRKHKAKSGKKALGERKQQADKCDPEQDNIPDYGGLPKRDLKKNLGCG
ncbi:MAG: hypothetical protein AB7K37_02600 [Cyclobacteriaceae bacterium]